MANEQATIIRGQGFSIQVVAPESKTGLTVTTSPSTTDILDGVTGVATTTNNASVSGEFYSFFLAPKASIALFTTTFEASESYYLQGVTLNITNEAAQNGFFIQEQNVLSIDAQGRATQIELSVSFTSSSTLSPSYKPAIINFVSELETQEATVSTAKVVKSTLFPKECSNIKQNLELTLQATINSQFKVTAVSSGIANILPDIIHTVRYQEDVDNVSVENAMYSVRIPIPAATSDRTWTITITPESGTSNASNVVQLELFQKGLKTITFTADTTNISNTTFPNQVITFSHGDNLNRRYYEYSSENLNRVRKDYQDVSITITSSSGNNTIKTATPRPNVSSSFTNIKENRILISDITTTQTSATVVTLFFKLKVPKITSSVTSAIKLSDFLTNS